MLAKQVLDSLFKEYKFDTSLYKKIVKNNIEFITKNDEMKHLFGSRLIGCFYVKYTQYDKNIFYNNLFNLDYSIIEKSLDNVTSIPKNFKVARDDINLVIFYIAHRFLNNTDLSKDKRLEYAKEVLNYFNYRTLVLISSNYFIYPITEEKALTLVERLSNKYIIKKVKNWNEYCMYRSEEYLKSKFLDLLISFNEKELPNAINDLFNRTKDTLKNIYREFVYMNDNSDIIASSKNVVNDVDGEDVIIDRIGNSESYIIKLESLVTSKDIFIKKEYIDVTISIIESVSIRQLTEALNLIIEYMYKDRDSNNKVLSHLKDVVVNCIDYLQQKDIYLGKHNNVINLINIIVGNLLYSRGTNVTITNIKNNGNKLLKEIYKYNKINISERAINNIKNAVYVYVLLRVLID